MSRTRFFVLIFAIVITGAAVTWWVMGVHRPTIASNSAIGAWIVFAVFTVGEKLIKVVRADQLHQLARAELVSTGSTPRPHLRRVD